MTGYEKLTVGRAHFLLPTGWQYCSARQLRALASIKMAYWAFLMEGRGVAERKDRLRETQIAVFFALLGSSYFKKMWVVIKLRLSGWRGFDFVDHLNALLPLSDWVVKGDVEFSTVVLKEFKHKGVVYAGWTGLMNNVLIKEWIYADTVFQKFVESGNEEYLQLLTGCLFRPKSKSTNDLYDYRDPYTEAQVLPIAEKLDGLPKDVLYAVYLQYVGHRALLCKRYPNVFSLKPNKAAKSSGGWGRLLIRVAHHGALGPLNVVKEYTVHDILQGLEYANEQAEEIEKQRKK